MGYIKLITRTEIIDQKIDISNYNTVSENLYRFISTYKYVLDLIKNERIYLYSSTNCNDPYDSSLPAPISKDEMQETFKPHKINYRSILQSEHTILCSFSELNDSIVMWAHYGNQQHGFCIEFDFSNCNYLKELLIKVDYSINYTPNNYYESLLKKSIQWNYENEWRIVGSYFDDDLNSSLLPSDNRRYISVKGCIKSVIIGKKTPLRKINRIRGICKKKNIDIKEIVLDIHTYKYNIL